MVFKNTRTGNILTVSSKETIEIMQAFSDIYKPYAPVKAAEPAEETAAAETPAEEQPTEEQPTEDKAPRKRNAKK